MKQNEKKDKDWSKEESWQIAVYKTDKALLELCDSLKPSSRLFPAHIHASGEKSEGGERSLIRVNMLDYSNGTGENKISVSDNLTPEDVRYIYSVLFSHLLDFDFHQEKIFGDPDENGQSIVRKMTISRYDLDSQGEIRRYPWYVEIQNGVGTMAYNTNGGSYCEKGTYQCQKKVSIYLNDRDMFALFARAEAYIRAFELEYAFQQNRIGNFTSLYHLLKQEIQQIPEYLQEGELAA